jgi:hypothetical protein
MPSVPKRVAQRLKAGIERFQPILASAKSRDVGEADTVTIVTDMLSDVFGYDKYSELTSEFAIRGTYCDLATKLDGKLASLVEVKAIGSELKDAHVKQAVDYAANQGVEWVILTNGIHWRVYHVLFTRPIEQELVIDLDFSALDPKSEEHIELLFNWCKEGWQRSALDDYHTHRQALSRFYLGALLLSEPVLEVIRRELRRACKDVRIDIEQVRAGLANEVIKREVLEGDKADEARRKVSRSANKSLRSTPPADEKEAEEPASPSVKPADPAIDSPQPIPPST